MIVVLELIFGSWFTEEHALHQFTRIRDRVILAENPLSTGKPTVRYSRDKYGLRGLDGDVSEIDILTVGGSTTDQRMVDDDETFQEVLEDLFAEDGIDVEVVNAGIDGQSTYGHIQNFSSWFDNINGIQAQYILYYVGINDLLKLEASDRWGRHLDRCQARADAAGEEFHQGQFGVLSGLSDRQAANEET